MYKNVVITFYFPNKDSKSYFYTRLDDLFVDLHYNLSMSVNTCIFFNITFVNEGVYYE